MPTESRTAAPDLTNLETSETYYELNPELLDEIIEQLKHADRRLERRRSTRQQFPVQQFMAPFARKMPKADQFVPVSCHDLSTSGIAFYWPKEPEFAQAIIGLGERSNLTYVTARVVRHAESKATGRVLVACEFIDRIAIS